MSTKNRRGGLGRGLGALIPTAPPAAVDPVDGPADGPVDPNGGPGSGQPPAAGPATNGAPEFAEVPGAAFAEVPVERIHPNAKQPRQVFDEDALAELPDGAITRSSATGDVSAIFYNYPAGKANIVDVVTAVSAGGESTNSSQASAIPLPSSQPTNLVMQAVGNQLQLSWPQDHLGWRLQIQTNDLNTGLTGNWVTVPNSTNANSFSVPMNPANGAVLLRLVYP